MKSKGFFKFSKTKLILTLIFTALAIFLSGIGLDLALENFWSGYQSLCSTLLIYASLPFGGWILALGAFILNASFTTTDNYYHYYYITTVLGIIALLIYNYILTSLLIFLFSRKKSAK